MENIGLIQEYLGGVRAIGSAESELDFVPIIRKGFPVSVFNAIRIRANLSEEDVCKSLRIAKRTAARRKQRGVRLKAGESELLLRLVRVLAKGTEVLGSVERARNWLLAENRALGAVVPITLLDTGIGFQQVIDVLNRIEHGVHS